jgi:hypothetical protein
MHSVAAFALAAAAALVWQGCASHSASKQQTKAAPEPFVRISNTVSNRLDFQIVLREFTPAHRKGPAVWLSGVSHVGESNYYAQIQHHLDSMTVVLFEGVGEDRDSAPSANQAAPADPAEHSTAASKRHHDAAAAAANNNGSLQTQLASSLGLVFQLDSIDYARTNFVHSDLSVSEIRDLMTQQDKHEGKEGEGRGAESFDNLVQMMEGGSLMDFLMRIGLKFIGANTYLQGMGKLALMESLEEIQGDPKQMAGLPDSMTQLMNVLIEKRNEHVFADLKKELKKIKPGGSISIFYGTGHMPDFEKQLREKLGYKPINQVWLTVFSVDLAGSGISKSEAQWIRNVVKQGMGSVPRGR